MTYMLLFDDELIAIRGGTCGSNIKRYRETMNLTQKQLAELLFVSQQTVLKWEYDINDSGIQPLKKKKKIFHTSVDNSIA